ncbi:Ger(x)C family spore germination protein [Fictibacillus sp. KIGAM418]|uniref:Ger(X)C family spore germination protein n=1 Tax=Fictibacillus marinisediminis TaxID=2878389 RepID=A0A9X1XBF6_9BACL|nr:Ger(x)C family spore germination protein [Fictibacillus marinisediminis]MCK6257827.1 Ger(x)C family spore germination protein [Fictibacillus marinisediminis]
MNLFLSRKFIISFTILLLLSSSFLLTGCWDRKEVNDMALVLGAAIDKSKGNNIELTIQTLQPRNVISGQQGTGGGGSIISVRSAVGENMADATSKLQTKISRQIFWGHCKVFIIGRKLAKKGGLDQEIDFLLRHPEPRENAHLFVSDGKAADIMELMPPLDRYEGEALRRLSQMRTGAAVTVNEFEEMLTGDGGGAILPLIKILPRIHGEEKAETSAYIAGTAIFRKDKMVGKIDAKVTRGLLWLRNEIKVLSITVYPKRRETLSLDPIRQKTRLIPKIKDGKWGITAKITSENTIVENGTNLDPMSLNFVKRIENEAKKDLKHRINLSLDQVQKGMKVDVFGFAEAFHRKYPKEWEKEKDHWDKVLPQVDVNTDITMRISRPGLSTTPAGFREEETKRK